MALLRLNHEFIDLIASFQGLEAGNMVRPPEYRVMTDDERARAAALVLTGKADALIWPEDET